MDRNDSYPGTSVSFSRIGVPSISGSNVVAETYIPAVGIYASFGGVITTVADLNTAIPGGTGNFLEFSGGGTARNPIVAGDQIVFRGAGSSGQGGIYLSSSGSLSVIVDSMPNISSLSFDGAETAFVGGGSVFVTNGGSLEVVATLGDVMPDRGYLFGGLHNVATSAGNVAFVGSACVLCGFEALYAYFGGSLVEVLGVGDVLDGRVVWGLEIGTDSMDGQDIAFAVQFADGSSGVYVASSCCATLRATENGPES